MEVVNPLGSMHRCNVSQNSFPQSLLKHSRLELESQTRFYHLLSSHPKCRWSDNEFTEPSWLSREPQERETETQKPQLLGQSVPLCFQNFSSICHHACPKGKLMLKKEPELWLLSTSSVTLNFFLQFLEIEQDLEHSRQDL